MMVFI